MLPPHVTADDIVHTPIGDVMELFKVSGKSSPSSIAGALVPILNRDGAVEIHSVGAAALNQAVKAIAIARGFLAPNGKDLVCVPAFMEISINGESRTALKLCVYLRDTQAAQPSSIS